MLKLTSDISGPLAGIEKMLGEDLPFTIARFLTMQAQSGQAAAREGERRVFKIRNDWTTMNTRITPATKQKLFSEVYTDTSNRKTGAPDYLPRQDEGGDRVPLAGHRFLAIPTRYLKRHIGDGIIPDAFRPKNLLPPGANLGETYRSRFNTGGVRARKAIGREVRAKLGSNEFAAFVQQTREGTLCIFIRHGGVANIHGVADAEPWFVLVKDAHIKARFPMEQLVATALEANQDKNFDRAVAEVMVNNALKSGLQVRF